MSGSTEFVEKMGKMCEKPSFSQTCSLLSQYLKERGSFGDLNLGMASNSESTTNKNGPSEMLRRSPSTMNLFPVSEKPGHISCQNMGARNFTSMDLFPQQAGFAPKEDVPMKLDSSKSATAEPQTAQMTIFYAGRVIVFNDFPADKAKEVMLLASKGSSQIQNAFPSIPANSHPALAPNISKTPIESTITIPSSSNALPNFGSNLIQEGMQPAPQPIANDLPIARRASLHRFLEKRKDRIIAKAPYQINPAATTSKPAESEFSWLGLAAPSTTH
uniref:Protein TIFY n=1 Tax=Populus trichocarpa x Populus deltoides TaxID=3695 RepID=A9PIL0_9ROSI|nr:unknown [Populus trichocarpa x Populus deltoides]